METELTLRVGSSEVGEGVNSYTEKLFAGISSLMEESCWISGRQRELRCERPACRRPALGTAGKPCGMADLGHCASAGGGRRGGDRSRGRARGTRRSGLARWFLSPWRWLSVQP